MQSSLSSTVRRIGVALAGIAAACALIIPSSAAAAAFTLKVHFPNHTPVAGKKWPISWTATKGSQKLSGKSEYQFYNGNALVSTQKGVSFSGGRGSDTFVFPGEAVGHPLKLRVMVITKAGTASAWWNVTTKK